MTPDDPAAPAAAPDTCAQCGKSLAADDRVESGGRGFCRACYGSLRAELQQYVEATSSDINYLNAGVGAVLGGAAGALAWWGFTVLTKISFGLIAVVIGYAVGHGTVRFSGGKRSSGLQALSVGVAVASFLVATYLVNMTFINRQLAQQGEAFRIAFPPQNLTVFGKVLTAGAGIMDAVFLAIVVWEAWKIPRPLVLPPDASA